MAVDSIFSNVAGNAASNVAANSMPFLSSFMEQGALGALNAGANTALPMFNQVALSGLGNLGQTALETGAGAFLETMAPQAVEQGFLGQLGDLLMDEKFQGAIGAGTNIFNAFNQYQQGQKASEMMGRKMAMAEDAYSRDKAADERRQKLVF